MALSKSYTVDFRWVLQAGIALSEKNLSLQKGLLHGQCFPRGRLPHPFQVPPALKASRAGGHMAVLQSGAGGLSSVCPAQPPQAVSDLATSQHLVFALESDAPQSKEEERAMKAWAPWSVSLSEAGWSSMAYKRWMSKWGYWRQYNHNNTGLYTSKQTAHALTSLSCREPNTVFSSAAGGTDLNALGDVKQRWSLQTADAENSPMLAEAFSPCYGALGCPQLPLQGSLKGMKKVSMWSLCLQLHPLWKLLRDLRIERRLKSECLGVGSRSGVGEAISHQPLAAVTWRAKVLCNLPLSPAFAKRWSTECRNT